MMSVVLGGSAVSVWKKGGKKRKISTAVPRPGLLDLLAMWEVTQGFGGCSRVPK
jgi:hypothetical protein